MSIDESDPWPIETIEHLGHYTVFSVSALHARRADSGYRHTFYRIDAADWVNVIALTPKREWIMVKQYRLGAAKHTLEIPGGIIDPGEEPGDAAERELLEETGYRPGAVVSIGAVSPNPALFSNTLHSFLATDCTCVAEIRNDPSEHTTVELIPQDAMAARVRAGEVDHALVLAAFYWLSIHER